MDPEILIRLYSTDFNIVSAAEREMVGLLQCGDVSPIHELRERMRSGQTSLAGHPTARHCRRVYCYFIGDQEKELTTTIAERAGFRRSTGTCDVVVLHERDYKAGSIVTS